MPYSLHITGHPCNLFVAAHDPLFLQCPHYKSYADIYAPCCKEFYPCHRCHDDKMEMTCGLLDRSTISQIRCRACGAVDEPSSNCSQCSVKLGDYVCLDCRLYRELHPSGIYHCPGCRICRIGLGLGKSHWHCDKCSSCLPNSLSKEKHDLVCLPDAMKGDCPICFEDMHGSSEPCVPGGNCGHFLHLKCLQEHRKHGRYKCPMCSKPFQVDTSPAAIALAVWKPLLLGLMMTLTIAWYAY